MGSLPITEIKQFFYLSLQVNDKIKDLRAQISEHSKDIKWKSFKLGDLFDIEPTWFYGKNRQYISELKEKNNNSLPVISGITVNNGVSFYSDDLIPVEEIFCDSLTISTRGEYSGTVTYHEGEFSLANNILVMNMPNWSKLSKLYIGTLIGKLGYGGYFNYPKKDTLKDNEVSLPTQNGKINFEYMDRYMTLFSTERQEQLLAYLSMTGLDNYELFEREKKVLEDCGVVNWQEYKLIDLFDISTTKKKFNAKDVKFGGPYNYVARGDKNNGIRGRINEDEKYLNDEKTISFGQDTATMFFQPEKYFTGDKIKIFTLRDRELSSDVAQFLITSMKKSFASFTWGGSSFSVEILNETKVLLPTRENNVDYDFIEKYITVVKKIVASSLVSWVEKGQ